jgi:hypothetical protein
MRHDRSVRRVTDEQRRARLAVRHRLLPATRTDDIGQIADSVLALHSTDPVTVYLSALVRMRHPDRAAVEDALYRDRSVIRHHAMRRTLWVATPDVVRRIHAAATFRLVEPERKRLAKLLIESGVTDPVAWLADARRQTLDYLQAHGPTNARELGERVPALRQPLRIGAGTKWEAPVAAHTRVLILLGFEGEILRGPPNGSWVSGAYRYAAAAAWLAGGLGGLDQREAAADLTRHWLRSFGPGTRSDLQWWMGWTAAMTKRALADVEAVAVELADGTGWLAADDDGTPDREPWVALLPSLDPTTMGWKQRDWYLPAAAADAFDNNGNAGPTIWVDGRVVGAWAQAADGDILLHFFEAVPAARRLAVRERAAELRDWLEDTRFSVRFSGRINAQLTSRVS